MQDSISINEEGAHIPPAPSPVRRVKPIDLSRELAWLRAHRHEYMEQWVALDGDRLLSHGADAQAVYEAARAAGVRAPLVEFIGPDDEKPFGGW